VSVVAAVLAAGSSQRLGAPKQLLTLCGGQTLVHHAAAEALASGVERVAVVVGAHAADVSRAVRDLDVELVENLDFAEGVASSIRAAVAWARHSKAQALLIVLCDQPRLSRAHLSRLLACSDGEQLVASYYAEKPAVPALFPARCFEALFALRGDRGASTLLRSASELSLVEWPDGELDVDTPDDAELASLETRHQHDRGDPLDSAVNRIGELLPEDVGVELLVANVRPR
jgi:CTP:molybdopterin cytidylyltransferase MocA